MKKVRFTGARTGREKQSVPRYGVIEQGQVVEVPDEVAERWTVLHATGRSLTAQEIADSTGKEELMELVQYLHPHLSTEGRKIDIATRLWAHDPAAFSAPPASDFELVSDGTEADVVRDADRVGSVDAPSFAGGEAGGEVTTLPELPDDSVNTDTNPQEG